ncbi:MAG: sigma-70 family RNA polymerase sigma factor [Deltaproteobacteria bacterium]|nr:sigma-70 family RNA polymerase sigma factor [Deltaproteobacteria bacterium]MBN2672982.1 sigma-70 family RNA polymerase sigma factor [Deltaproteobacteria bacterium]
MEKQYSTKTKVHLYTVRTDEPESRLFFNDVFNRFASYVASVALRLLGDESIVDDMVQDVFLDCYRKLDTLQSMEHARRWLVKVTVRKASKRLHRNKMMRLLRLADASSLELSIPVVTAEQRSELALLYRLLDRLPVPVRLAWSMRYLEGAQISDVAFACGCSVATAKRRIRAAQETLLGVTHE